MVIIVQTVVHSIHHLLSYQNYKQRIQYTKSTMPFNNSTQNKSTQHWLHQNKPRLSHGNQPKRPHFGKQNQIMSSHKNLNQSVSDQKLVVNKSISNQTNDNLKNAELHDMIELLKQYEKECLEKQDFYAADEAKNKIDVLKTQQLLIRKQELENESRQNIQRISKEGENQIKMFQEYWDEQLQELIDTLKQVEANLTEQHQRQLQQIQGKLNEEEPPKIKFSSQILQLRKHLRNLIKVKNYKEADIIKQKLQTQEKDESQKWGEKFQIKKHHKLVAIIKKQECELKALRIRLEGVFNEKLKERDQKFQILLKKNRKRRIESGKVSRERLQTKAAIINESRSIQSTMGVISNNTYKF